MDENQVIVALRAHAGLRVGRHTARYVSAQLAAGANESLAIFAQDARTGIPVQARVKASAMSSASLPE